MKRIILLTICILLINYKLNAQQEVYNNINLNEFYQSVYDITASDLKLDSARIIIYISLSEFNERITLGLDATTKYLGNNCFVINIRPDLFKKERFIIFIHELVHVSQILHNRLIISDNSVKFEDQTYTYSKYNPNVAYEQEAFELSQKIYNKHQREFKMLKYKQ